MRCNTFIFVLLLVGLSVLAEPDHIKAQKRSGAHIIITYESGAVVTNSLFLRMSPDVVRGIERKREEQQILTALQAVVSDTRSNITEVAGLSDSEIATLYLQQMRKSTTPLLEFSPVDTVEYVIGAGIRQDLTTPQKNEKIK
jgi:hypothetical protein